MKMLFQAKTECFVIWNVVTNTTKLNLYKYFTKGKAKMRFENVNDVKKWFRGIVVCKREMELKLEFYKDLLEDFEKTEDFCDSVKYYKEQIEALQKRMKTLMEEADRLMSYLDEDEKMIMTARYINLIKWDFIEFQVYYSRRQAIRIHDRAVEKLVGMTVKE